MMIFLQEKFTQDVSTLALAFLPAGLVWALLPSRLGRLADRFGRKPLMVLGMAVAAMTSFLIPGLGSLVMLAVIMGVAGAVLRCRRPGRTSPGGRPDRRRPARPRLRVLCDGGRESGQPLDRWPAGGCTNRWG